MLRFLAFLYDSRDGPRADAYREAVSSLTTGSDHGWKLAYRSPGMAVWCAGCAVQPWDSGMTAAHRGVVLGRLFHREGGDSELSRGGLISHPLAAAICESDGGELGSHFWGHYVAFLRDEARDRHCVIRDPTGTVPCFHVVHRGLRIFFSDITDIRRSPLFSFKVNPEFLKAGILLPRIQKTITGLEGVCEVLPGEFWTEASAGKPRTFIWNPYDFAREPLVDDVETAATMVREVTERTIWTLAKPFRRIAHHLGGLDSSIIYSCLARAPSRPHISLVNHVTPSPRGDERFYARQMAARYGAPLTEVHLDHRRVDFHAVARASDQVSPLGFYDFLDVAADSYARDEILGADALFYGVGGDNVFMQSAGLYPVLDYVHDRGVDFGLFRIAAHAMRDSRRSALHVARAAFRERLSREPVFDHVYPHLFSGVTGSGFNRAIIEEGPRTDLIHPMLIPPEGTCKGKLFQVLSSCLSPIEYYDQFFRATQVERIHVFYSQPIVETCLRIPSWILALRGLDRGLARLAFRDLLPDSVLRRLAKGTPEEVYEGFIRDNRAALRAFLIDGLLVKLGICCARSLERILSGTEIEFDAGTNTIINLFGLESWARNWAEA